MNRRSAIGLGLSASLLSLPFSEASAVDVSGRIQATGITWGRGRNGFFLTSQSATASASINGVSLPNGSWGWIAGVIGVGILNAIGGAIFSAIANALLGQGKDLEKLLAEQLETFVREVQAAIANNELRRYQADFEACLTLYKEYENERTRPARLDFVINRTAENLAQLESMGFGAYRTYMSAAGLRLSVLQDLRSAAGLGPEKNFIEQRRRAIAHHQSIVSLIERETDPSRSEAVARARATPLSGVMNTISTQILGVPVSGFLATSVDRPNRPGVPPIGGKTRLSTYDESNAQLAYARAQDKKLPLPGLKSNELHPIDWAEVRARLKRENTDIGDQIVATWRAAPTRSRTRT